ncbi:unnamed protein product [Clonostachys solani]|uniref:DUF7730 domain-containing protein n=1 Tax=Clonostachys solani TaxID=160281 RepID=A0A9P0EKK8_9HYPO|nr:unnamed protein product [Clonostachys solani]
MRRLLETLRSLGNKSAPGQAHPPPPPPPPLLPTDRPRPNTPPDPSTPGQVDRLGTLSRLPAEICRQILTAAFGGRELHLDLRLVPRHWRPLHGRTGESAHGRGSAPWSGITPKFNPQDEREWRWYGCVCHRQIPWRRPHSHSWPHHDACLVGEANLCSVYPPPPGMPAGSCDYIIGALGWLRTCRQAYVEGISVLYGSNVFILESQELLDLLLDPAEVSRGHVVLPQHLALIKSLEVRIDTMLFQRPGQDYSGGYRPNWNGRRSLPHLGGLKAAFPRLHFLVISFTEYLYDDGATRPAARLLELKNVLLEPLAEALAPFASTQKQPFVVELPIGVFSDLVDFSGFAREVREHRFAEGWAWLRYPIRCSDKELFYYIKQGTESGLYWDHQDRPRTYGDTWGHLVLS